MKQSAVRRPRAREIDVGGGSVVTASITVEAVDELGLREGDVAYAIIKASSVIVAKD